MRLLIVYHSLSLNEMTLVRVAIDRGATEARAFDHPQRFSETPNRCLSAQKVSAKKYSTAPPIAIGIMHRKCGQAYLQRKHPPC